MNSVVFAGHLGKDAETRKAGDKVVTTFSLAVKKGKDKTLWLNCEQWESKVTNYLKKGTFVCVQGELDIEEYTDKEGVKKTSTKVKISSFGITFGSKSETSDNAATPQNVAQNSTDLPF